MCKAAVAYLVDVQNFTSGLLHLAHLVHEVPESGLSSDLIAGKQLHSVCRGVGISGGGGLSADHLVKLHLNKIGKEKYIHIRTAFTLEHSTFPEIPTQYTQRRQKHLQE
jgi:hypothetical protein